MMNFRLQSDLCVVPRAYQKCNIYVALTEAGILLYSLGRKDVVPPTDQEDGNIRALQGFAEFELIVKLIGSVWVFDDIVQPWRTILKI